MPVNKDVSLLFINSRFVKFYVQYKDRKRQEID